MGGLLTDWCKIKSLFLVPLPNYWIWIKTTPEKKRFFCSNLYKSEIMITSYANVRITKLWSHDHNHNVICVMWQNFVGDVIDRIYDVITFISKYLYFRKVCGSHSCWHDQNFDHIFRTIYKDWRKVKINRKYESKYNLYLHFVI